jgi:hypothetical protein
VGAAGLLDDPAQAALLAMRDQESEPSHPLSEDVSPPVFAIVALVIIAASLAVFALLGMFP